MRLRHLLPVVLGALVWAADTPTPPTNRPPATEPSAEEIKTIRKIMELAPERIRGMREAIEHIEHISTLTHFQSDSYRIFKFPNLQIFKSSNQSLPLLQLITNFTGFFVSFIFNCCTEHLF